MIRVGCCGYPVSMKKYRETFSLVELNNTFYNYPRISTAEKWRRDSPEEFEFTVKAHQDISHKHKLRLELAREPFERMKEICRTLKAHILLIQTPASFRPESLKDAEEFFGRIDRSGLRLIWETRGPLWENDDARGRLRDVLERLDVPHVTDPFRIMPIYTGGTAYFRLHGLGRRMYYYQYTNEELKGLYEAVKPYDSPGKEVYILFNNLSMFDDAKRFLQFLRDGVFPSLTKMVGLDSVRTVTTGTRYPASKSILMERLGWRLVELEDKRQIQLSQLLKDIPSKTYENVGEVLKEIRLP